MHTAVQVAGNTDIARAFASRARRIRVVVPDGRTESSFLAGLIVHASTLPQLAGFDIYEVEAIVREMSLH